MLLFDCDCDQCKIIGDEVSVSSIKEPTSIIMLENEDEEKSVKMSHVEIVEVDDAHRRSRVFFYPEAEIIDPMIKAEQDAPEKIYKSKKTKKAG